MQDMALSVKESESLRSSTFGLDAVYNYHAWIGMPQQPWCMCGMASNGTADGPAATQKLHWVENRVAGPGVHPQEFKCEAWQARQSAPGGF